MKNLLARALAIIAGAVLFVGAFLVSVVFFAVALGIGLVFVAYFLWRTRHVRRQMRERYAKGDVIDGEVIAGQVIEGQVLARQVIEGEVSSARKPVAPR